MRLIGKMGKKRDKMHLNKVSYEGEVCEFSGWEMNSSDGNKRADGSLVRVT